MDVSVVSRLGVFLIGVLAYTTGKDVVNIGVIPTWHEVVANASQRVPDFITKRFFDVYDREGENIKVRMDKVYQRIEEHDLTAIIGPFDNAVSLAAEEKKIPYLATTPVTKDSLDFTIQLIPELEEFCKAILEFAHRHGWKKISVFYDDDKGLTLLQRLMTSHNLNVKAWRLHDPEKHGRNKTGDPRKIMKSRARQALVQMRKVLVEHSIVFCGKEYTRNILEVARDLAMLSTPPYEWAFFDPGDIMQELFEPYSDIAVNFTVFTLLEYNTTFPRKSNHILDTDSKLKYALSHDAVQLLSSAVVNYTKPDLLTAIKENQEVGETGYLQLDENGKRDNISIYLTGIMGTHGYPVSSIYTYLHGIWYQQEIRQLTHKHLVLYDCLDCENRTLVFPLKGRKVDVVMILEEPFTMLKRDHTSRLGNDKYEGFAVDLLEEAAFMLGFQYRIYLVPDGNFGTKKSGEWNGMIKELLDGEATMSVAPLSINSQREEAVDFTKPFMTRYISVLLKIPKREVSYFEFLNPLSPIVWGCTLAAFVVVSFVLYMLERIGSTKQRTNPQISVRESFWFIFGSLLQGNTDACPITIPGRILTSSWWFFALILISSYTANLAAFLTVKKINTPIKTVTDLAQQTKIKYGTVKNSGVMSFFAHTNIEHFSKMWAQMSEIEPDSMTDNTTEGYAKVKDGNYAFFWDTTVNKYKTITDCDMMEIGPPFDPKGFGIGVPPGATYLDDLSMTILKLSDSGVLHQLENKWWDSRHCPDLGKSSSDETSELQIENVAGVFFILVGGIVIAGLACLAEYCANCIFKANKTNKKEKPDFLANSKEKASFL